MEQASGAVVQSGGQPLRGGGTSLNKHYYIRMYNVEPHLYLCMYIHTTACLAKRTYKIYITP